MNENITRVDRVFKMLEILSKGEEISLEQIQKEDNLEFEEKTTKVLEVMKEDYKFIDVDVCLKTLQNDMVYIKNYLGDNLTKKGSSYKLVQQKCLDDFFTDNHEEIRKFFHAISLIDKSVFGGSFEKYAPMLESMKEKQEDVYLFLENPFEELKKFNLMKDLEEYICKKIYINIHYSSSHEFIYKKVQPYKIIYQNGAWYLAVLTTEDYEINGAFKLLRMNFIEKVELYKGKENTFHDNIQVTEFLKNKFQSLFTSYDRSFFTVKLRVSKEASRFFKVKKYLKSQRILGKIDDDLLVELTINDEMEIIPLVQKWMPHIKVLEPKYIHEKILNNIAQYE